MTSFSEMFARRPRIFAVMLLATALLTYANSFPGAFILDDHLIVEQNPLVNQLDLAAIFQADYWHGVNSSGLFRPLTILSLALNRWLLGPAPPGYHLVNVMLHAGVVLLLWRVLLVWGIPALAALLAALLFAVHPLHTGVINEVVGRSELLAAFFLLAACWFARRSSWAAAWLTFPCYLLALLAKEHAIILLVLLPLWDGFQTGMRRAVKDRWPFYAGLLAMACIWLLWREFGVASAAPRLTPSAAAAPLAHVDALTRVVTALQLQWLYLLKLFLPHGLQSVYIPQELPLLADPFSWQALLVTTGTAGVLTLLGWQWRQRSAVAMFAIFYLIAFLPTANLLFPIGVTFAERLTYFPSVWFCTAAGLVLALLVERRRASRWAWVVVVGYLLFLTGSTLVRNPDYASEIRLWRAEVADNPGDFVGWLNLAESLTAAGTMSEADSAYRTLLALAPDEPTGLRSRLAFFLLQREYAQAVELATRLFAESQVRGDLLAMAFDGRSLAESLLGVGECVRALALLEGPALPLVNQPQTVETRLAALSCLGRDTAVLDYLAGPGREVSTRSTRYQAGVSLMRLGRHAEARRVMEASLATDGKWAEGWNLLGVACVELKTWPAAVAAFTRAVELAPEDASFRDNLQQARQEGGQGGN